MAGSEGFLTGKGRAGLVGREVVWGEMDFMVSLSLFCCKEVPSLQCIGYFEVKMRNFEIFGIATACCRTCSPSFVDVVSLSTWNFFQASISIAKPFYIFYKNFKTGVFILY